MDFTDQKKDSVLQKMTGQFYRDIKNKTMHLDVILSAMKTNEGKN
jgi:hypothetical protein